MYSVLLVDDYRVFLKQIERFSYWKTQEDFSLAYQATNGADALQILQQNPVDVVITDIKMPKMTGLDLLGEIVEQNLDTTVILLSEYEDFSYAQKGLQLGAFDYLVKPLNEQKLVEVMTRVKHHLEQKENQNDPLLLQRKKLLLDLFSEEKDPSVPLENFLSALHQAAERSGESTESLFLYNLQKIVKPLFHEAPWLKQFLEDFDEMEERMLHSRSEEQMGRYFQEVVMEITGLLRWCRRSSYSDLTKRTCTYLMNHICEKLTLSHVAANCFVNKSYLSHVFKVETGVSFVEFVTMFKMYAAQKLLSEPDSKINEAAIRLGYDDPKYFTRNFKDYCVMTPAEFKKSPRRLPLKIQPETAQD